MVFVQETLTKSEYFQSKFRTLHHCTIISLDSHMQTYTLYDFLSNEMMAHDNQTVFLNITACFFSDVKT